MTGFMISRRVFLLSSTAVLVAAPKMMIVGQRVFDNKGQLVEEIEYLTPSIDFERLIVDMVYKEELSNMMLAGPGSWKIIRQLTNAYPEGSSIHAPWK